MSRSSLQMIHSQFDAGLGAAPGIVCLGPGRLIWSFLSSTQSLRSCSEMAVADSISYLPLPGLGHS